MNHTEEVKEWLQKAKNDRLAARILIEHDPPVLDAASFHCQQAVEKMIKGFLSIVKSLGMIKHQLSQGQESTLNTTHKIKSIKKFLMKQKKN